jgi:hypothetical protein
LINALASDTRVFWPAESLPIEQLRQIEFLGERRDACVAIHNAIEAREHGQILPDGEPVRHLHVRAFEIHAVQNLVTLARHIVAEDAHGPRRRGNKPHDHRNGRGLAGAIAAEEPDDRAAFDCKRDPGNRGAARILLDQVGNRDGGFGGEHESP